MAKRIFESKHLKEYMKEAEAELLKNIKSMKGETLKGAVHDALRKAFLYGQSSTLTREQHERKANT